MVLCYGELTENTVIILDLGVTNFPYKRPDSTLDFVSHTVSATTTWTTHIKGYEQECYNKTLFTRTGYGLDLACSCSLPTPA